MTVEFSWALLAAAFGGGMFGAAIGTLPSFIFTGFFVIAGVAAAAAGGGTGLLDHVAFGPFLGPHIAFGGGVAALGYARRRGLIASARDTTPPLMGLDRTDVLLVGGAFGALGYLLERGFQALGWGPWTDTVALTVVVSAAIVRLAFGTTGLFGTPSTTGSRFRPDDAANWVRWQEKPGQLIAIGLGAGLPSAYAALMLGADGGGAVAGFGIAAASLIFAQMGGRMAVTHHIALPAALAALASGSVAAGAAFGVAGAFAGEASARLLLIRGDTHIDPPAAAIAAMTLVVRLADAAGWFAAFA